MLKVLSRKKSIVALEMIDFQDNTFGMQIETLLLQLKDKIINKTYINNDSICKSSEVIELEKLVFKRIGLKINIITNQALAAILPFYPNKHSIFIHDMFKGAFTLEDQEKVLKQAIDKKGYVDTKKAKLGGLFSEYINNVYLNFYELFINLKMSESEVTAIMLHELGHGFYSCEYSDRLESTNQVLANVALKLINKKENKDLVYIYKELSTVNSKITEEQVDKLVNGDRIVAGYTWFTVVIETVKAQLLNNKYDETAFEQMADNFANRFGYGRQLILGLDKLYKAMGSPEKYKGMNTFMQITSVLSTLLFTTVMIAVICVMFPVVAIAAILITLYLYLALLIAGEGAKDYTYDSLKIRYKRVRQDCVEFLKSNDIDKIMVKEVLANIYLIDEIITNTYTFETLFNKLSNVFISFNRNAKRAIDEQQLLEELTFNNLFIQSSKLSVF